LQARLAGVVESLSAVRLLGGRGTEGAVLTFRDAKAAVVAYDAARHDLETLSLHSFEDMAVQVRGGGGADAVAARPGAWAGRPAVLRRHVSLCIGADGRVCT
jgi:hypothetical protein